MINLSKKQHFYIIIKYKDELISSFVKNFDKKFILIIKYEHNKFINSFNNSLSKFKIFNKINKYFSNLNV